MDNGLSTTGNVLSITDKGLITTDSGPSNADEYEPALRMLAAKAHLRRRMRPQDRDDLVVRMCEIQPLSVQDLADLLGRSLQHVHAVLQHLIAEGRLSYEHSQQPRHPYQRYIANPVTTHKGEL